MNKAFLLLLGLSLLLSAAGVQAADNLLVLGRAPMSGSEAAAKQKAVADALSRAVAQQATNLVDPATLRRDLAVLDKQVLSDARKFITYYSLLASTQSGASYLALVSVTVDDRALSQALIRAALKMPTAHVGSVLIMVSEEAAPGRPPLYWWSGLPGAPQAPAPMVKVLKALGIKMIDPKPLKAILTPHLRHPVLNEANALEIARQAGAKLVIVGSVRTYPLVTPEHVYPSPLVQLLALDTMTSRQIALVEADGPVYHTTPPREARQVVLATVEATVRDLMAQVAATDSAAMPTENEILLTVTGVRSLAQLYRFERVLTDLSENVTRLTRESVGPGRAVLKLTISGSASALADKLLVQNYGDFLVNVVEASPTRMDVVLIPKQGIMAPVPPLGAAAMPKTAPGQVSVPARAINPAATPAASPAPPPAPPAMGAGQTPANR